MSGWAFDVTLSKVKRKTKRVRVSAYTPNEAIENAKLAAADMDWEESRTEMEYDVREVF